MVVAGSVKAFRCEEKKERKGTRDQREIDRFVVSVGHVPGADRSSAARQQGCQAHPYNQGTNFISASGELCRDTMIDSHRTLIQINVHNLYPRITTPKKRMDPSVQSILYGRGAGLTLKYRHLHSLWRSLDSLLQLPTGCFLEMIKGSAMVNPM